MAKKNKEVEETSGDEVRESGIVVKESTFTAEKLPLIVELPEDASKAQIARAKILNAYAYSNPVGWKSRKAHLIEELEALKDAPDPVENDGTSKLSVGAKIPDELSA